jgi:hypothetical protein
MKTWLRRDEWMYLAACWESEVHTAEDPSPSDCDEAEAICGGCRVRPECIQWAIRDRASSVFVAGIYLPDPQFKRELRLAYKYLQGSLDQEFANRKDV